ncbi:MAG: hypothetical protein KH186_00195 [Lachnospiraceae bacterium]|nr:hypothetical protein [Lachnospiraceae bacterium]
MTKSVKMYNVLISCPTDVAEYVENIKNGINRFNNTYGEAHGILVQTKYWLEDSFSESGGEPQELLNKQIVEPSDMAIAVFWTRFGEATTYFGSGTEEEIEIMLSRGKQVFLYFLDKPIPPSKMNSYEYKKIENFKKKYREKGIYFMVKDENELESRIGEGLIRYFSK